MRRADIILENSRKLKQVLNKELPAQKSLLHCNRTQWRQMQAIINHDKAADHVSGNGQLQWKLLSSSIIVSV